MISEFPPSLWPIIGLIFPYYSPQIALARHTSIPDPEMTWLLDTTLGPI